jgi:hypothetical protein
LIWFVVRLRLPFGDAFAGVRSVNFFGGSLDLFSTSGALVRTITNPVVDAGVISGVHSAPALSPTATIDNGQAGYAETGTWTTAGSGFNGNNRYTATGSTDIATGTVDVGQVPGANISTLGSSSGPATTPTMSISGVRNSTRMTVLYNRDLPPQRNQPALPSLVDTVLSQYGAETTRNKATEAIISLAFDLVSSKKSKR